MKLDSGLDGGVYLLCWMPYTCETRCRMQIQTNLAKQRESWDFSIIGCLDVKVYISQSRPSKFKCRYGPPGFRANIEKEHTKQKRP